MGAVVLRGFIFSGKIDLGKVVVGSLVLTPPLGLIGTKIFENGRHCLSKSAIWTQNSRVILGWFFPGPNSQVSQSISGAVSEHMREAPVGSSLPVLSGAS